MHMAILAPLYAHPRDRVAALVGVETIAYGRLCDDIDAMARWLLAGGLRPGDRVTLHSQAIANPAYWDWIMHLGALRAGLAQSTGPMPPAVAASGAIGPYAAAVGKLGGLGAGANPARRMKFVPQGSKPLAERIELAGQSQPLDGLEAKALRLLSTSGTTGQPKVVVWDAELFEARLRQVREIGDLTPDTVLLTLLGLITTTGLRYPLAAWQIGATVLLKSFGGEASEFAPLAGASTSLATSPFRMREILALVPGDWPGSSVSGASMQARRSRPAEPEVARRGSSMSRPMRGSMIFTSSFCMPPIIPERRQRCCNRPRLFSPSRTNRLRSTIGGDGGRCALARTGASRLGIRVGQKAIIPSSTSPMKMHKPMPNGPARICQPKPNGNLPPAARWKMPIMPGAMRSCPMASSWPTSGTDNFRISTPRQMVSSARLRWEASRPMAMACSI